MTNQMQIIWKKLGSLGYKKNWLQKNIMPIWWEDKLAQDPVNKKIAELTLSKFLGIPLEKLRNEEIILEKDSFEERVCFKTNSNNDIEKNYPSLKVCYSLAKSILANVNLNSTSDYKFTALDIRGRILKKTSKIDLNSLLDFCWESGIPVVHTENLPYKVIDGLVFSIGGAKIIFLTLKNSISRNAFNLAHEIGHIFSGHLENDDILQDFKIDYSSSSSKEKQANLFATELISGKREFEFERFYRTSANELIREKESFENISQYDFGIALEFYAFQNRKDPSFNPYPLISKVQKNLGNLKGANKIINDKFLENIDLNSFDETTLNFIEKTLGLEIFEKENSILG